MTFPTSLDLRNIEVPVYDQGSEGSCTANAVVDLLEVMEHRRGNPIQLSRQFVYYNSREEEQPKSITDVGAMVWDVPKALVDFGVCTETLWPYVEGAVNQVPTPEAYADAINRRVSSTAVIYDPNDGYASPNDIHAEAVKGLLNSDYPVMMAISVHDPLFTINGALSTHPAQFEKYLEYPITSGHAVVIVGYNDDDQCFIVRNSWGTNWGDQGYFYYPYRIFNTVGEVMYLMSVTVFDGSAE